MRNLFLLFLAVTLSLTTSPQLKGWNVSTGATISVPIAKNVDLDSKFWGQRVSFTKKSVNVTLGFMQNSVGDAQIPVLIGAERGLGKVFHVGLRTGMTFFNGQKGQFTYMPSVRYNLNKKWCVEQSVLRMVKDGKHASQVGFGAFYHF